MTSDLTLKDVALLAGVSEMTASRALRNANDVSINTRKKVMDAAASIGYVPNRIAGSLASKKSELSWSSNSICKKLCLFGST